MSVVLLRWNQQEVQGLLSPLLCRFVKQMLNKSLVAFPIMILYHCASASSLDSQHGQVVKKTQCRLGYTESHTAAPGFGPGEVTEGPFIFVSFFVFTSVYIKSHFAAPFCNHAFTGEILSPSHHLCKDKAG